MQLDKTFWDRTDSMANITPEDQMGGGFGGSVALRIGRHWEMKMLTMLQLHNRNLKYTWQGKKTPKRLENTRVGNPASNRNKLILFWIISIFIKR